MECLVCHVENRGQHFGVLVCRACSAFFRRTIQLNLKYKCRFHRDCDVTHKNRYSCRACRMVKCYALGMANHDNARKEICKRRTSNEHFVPDDIVSSPDQSVDPLGPSAIQSHIVLDVASMLKQRLDQIFETNSHLQFIEMKPVRLCDQAIKAYQEHNKNWPNCSIGNLTYTSVVDLNAFMQVNYIEVEHVANFCMSLTAFVKLPTQQKWQIFKHFWPRFVELDRTFVSSILLGYGREDTRMVNFDGVVVDLGSRGVIGDLSFMSNMSEKQLRSLLEQSVLATKKAFTDPFKSFRPDLFEVIYMMMTIMWNDTKLTSLSDITMLLAGKIQNLLSDELHSYYIHSKKTPNYASRLYKIQHLLKGLDEVSRIRKEDGYMSRTFNVFKQDIFLNDLK